MKFDQLEQGQTLVETMVAIFILVMGITAALGLAIYSLNATSLVNKQIVGMGLAREGMEAVKNMRDTNWLQSGQFDGSCNCYLDWESSYYNIKPNGSQTYVLNSHPTALPYWSLTQESSNFRLSYDSTVASGKYYFPNSIGGTAGDYYRRITLTENSSAPYNATSPRLDVITDVWWNDKKCPSAPTYEQSKTSCRIRLQTYLTNWKNY